MVASVTQWRKMFPLSNKNVCFSEGPITFIKHPAMSRKHVCQKALYNEVRISKKLDMVPYSCDTKRW